MQTETLTVGRNGTSGPLDVRERGVLAVDFEVERGKELRLAVVTEAQFQQMSRGEKLTSAVRFNVAIKDSGSQSTTLEPGKYEVVFILNYAQQQSAHLSYRASFRTLAGH